MSPDHTLYRQANNLCGDMDDLGRSLLVLSWPAWLRYDNVPERLAACSRRHSANMDLAAELRNAIGATRVRSVRAQADRLIDDMRAFSGQLSDLMQADWTQCDEFARPLAAMEPLSACALQAMRLTHLMGNLQDAIRREILSDASAIVRFYTEEEQ